MLSTSASLLSNVTDVLANVCNYVWVCGSVVVVVDLVFRCVWSSSMLSLSSIAAILPTRSATVSSNRSSLLD
jgi:hypothetical protein